MSSTIGSSNHSAAYKPQVASGSSSPISPQQRLGNLFQQIDTDGKGHITKAQFEQAFGKLSLPTPVKDMGHEAVLKKLDPNGTGVITKPEFIQRMEPLINQKASATKVAQSTTESEPPLVNARADDPTKMSPLDGFALGNIINISV